MPDRANDFTELVCGISSRLAGAAGETIASEVLGALEATRSFLGADQCAFLKVVNERRAVVMLHRVAIEGVPPVPTDFDYGSTFPATYHAVFEEHRPYVLDRLEDLPSGEAVQRETSRAIGLCAYIAVPIMIAGEARYSLALGSGCPHEWPREHIAYLQALGETIASALERERDDERVRRSAAELAGAQRVAGMGSWTRDFVADHFHASDEAYRIIGSRPNSSEQWRLCIHPEDRERAAAEVSAALGARRTSFKLEYRVVRPGGDVRTIVDQGEVRYHVEGHPASAIGTIQDVTDARRTDRELRDLRATIWHADRAARAGALGSSLSHELGQPLTAILANAQAGLRMLAGGAVDAGEMTSILEAVVRDDRRAIAIIDGLRALLRKEPSVKAPVDLAEALAEVLALLRGELDGLGVRVDTRLEPGCMAMAVKAQVQQIALNLMSNALEAVRAKPPGERRIELAVAPATDAVEVAVSDSGRGIDDEKMVTIFEPFRSTRSGGLGLGLAISRSIVEAHEGRIGVERNGWGGATFRFFLPAIAIEAAQTAAMPSGPASRSMRASSTPGAPLVCIVDDDASVRESLGRLLAASGYAVAAFASGRDLLAAEEVGRAACALLDVRMDDLPGPEVHRRIADLHPALPVLFLTAHGDVPTGVGALQSGAVDFLLKPVEDGVLLGAVARAVRAGARDRSRESARREAAERLGRLSPREREIMDHVVRGRLNKQIAADLGISEATVKQHRGRVMEKTGVRSVAELVRLCELAEPASYQGRIPAHRADA